MRAFLVVGGLVLGAAAYYWKLQQDQTATGSGQADAINNIGNAINVAVNSMTPYALGIRLPGNQEYVDYIATVEASNGIPAGLLTRLAWQESRFREDIITGQTVSKAGAKGMFQLMPIHWTYVNPLDWQASAEYAAAMLLRLYRRFGTWALALAAYNWGEGNLSKFGIAAAPLETRNYYSQILADAGLEVTFA